jgi:hypothetical protein
VGWSNGAAWLSNEGGWYKNAAAHAPFVGAGDVKSSAFAWWGLRGYNAAYATGSNPAIDLVDQAGANLITINIKLDGTLDTTAIATWVAAHSVTAPKCKKWYDQSGNGWHLTQTTLANMPDYCASTPGLGGGNQPSLQFLAANGQTMTSASTGLNTATGSFSSVAVRTNGRGGNFGGVLQAGSASILYNNSSDVGNMFIGGSNTFTMLELNPHAVQWVFNTSSSFVSVDNVVTNLTIGTGTNITSPFQLASLNGVTTFTGNISEVGFWNTVFSTPDAAALTANQDAFWWAGPKYEGLVSSRCRLKTSHDATNKNVQSRSAHIASENLTGLRILFECRSDSVITGSVEFPAGTFRQAKFFGSASGGSQSPDSSLDLAYTDYLPVSIPAGSLYWVWSLITSSTASDYNAWQNTFLGEVGQLSASPLTDLTMTGGMTNSGSPSGISAPPLAIFGYTTNPSALLLGDSIQLGTGDTEDSSSSATGFNAKVGIVARSLGSVPFLNLGVAGETALNNNESPHLWVKCSHLISNFLSNDFFGVAAQSSAQGIASLNLIFAKTRPFQKKFQTTVLPRTSTADGWITTTNQTALTGNTPRQAFNTALRGGTTGLSIDGFYDVCTPLESALNSGKWLVTPSPPYTGDGIHPNAAGYALVPGSGVVTAPSWP